jgi:FAD:protein FMN transferase
MFSLNFECMGTVFKFSIADDLDLGRIEEDVAIACSILVDADKRFSLYKPESETSRLNTQELLWDKASPVQVEVKTLVGQWKDKTDGFFDAVSPDGIYDPSGLVKTWAAANAALYLEAKGYGDFTLNAGGDVYLGPRVKTHPLSRVGLSNLKSIAEKDASVNMILDLTGSSYRAVATSGSAERGEHIWGKTNHGEAGFLQATVVATDLVTADIWATALISGGNDAFAHFEKMVSPDQAVAVATSFDGRLTTSAGFAQVLASLQ